MIDTLETELEEAWSNTRLEDETLAIFLNPEDAYSLRTEHDSYGYEDGFRGHPIVADWTIPEGEPLVLPESIDDFPRSPTYRVQEHPTDHHAEQLIERLELQERTYEESDHEITQYRARPSVTLEKTTIDLDMSAVADDGLTIPLLSELASGVARTPTDIVQQEEWSASVDTESHTWTIEREFETGTCLTPNPVGYEHAEPSDMEQTFGREQQVEMVMENFIETMCQLPGGSHSRPITGYRLEPSGGMTNVSEERDVWEYPESAEIVEEEVGEITEHYGGLYLGVIDHE